MSVVATVGDFRSCLGPAGRVGGECGADGLDQFGLVECEISGEPVIQYVGGAGDHEDGGGSSARVTGVDSHDVADQ